MNLGQVAYEQAVEFWRRLRRSSLRHTQRPCREGRPYNPVVGVQVEAGISKSRDVLLSTELAPLAAASSSKPMSKSISCGVAEVVPDVIACTFGTIVLPSTVCWRVVTRVDERLWAIILQIAVVWQVHRKVVVVAQHRRPFVVMEIAVIGGCGVLFRFQCGPHRGRGKGWAAPIVSPTGCAAGILAAMRACSRTMRVHKAFEKLLGKSAATQVVYDMKPDAPRS